MQYTGITPIKPGNRKERRSIRGCSKVTFKIRPYDNENAVAANKNILFEI
jgi:hypothetical protein